VGCCGGTCSREIRGGVKHGRRPKIWREIERVGGHRSSRWRSKAAGNTSIAADSGRLGGCDGIEEYGGVSAHLPDCLVEDGMRQGGL
jgi:hypothetical protein